MSINELMWKYQSTGWAWSDDGGSTYLALDKFIPEAVRDKGSVEVAIVIGSFTNALGQTETSWLHMVRCEFRTDPRIGAYAVGIVADGCIGGARAMPGEIRKWAVLGPIVQTENGSLRINQRPHG